MMAPKTPNTEEQISYNDALAELDEILAELEGDSVDVDHLGTRVKRAAELIALCRGRISSARLEIESVVADLDRLTDTPSV
jgi:exodeoxyribonuclease VII small subunit